MINTGWAVGLMTGTVLDGEIDVALLRNDGESVFESGPFYTHRYTDATQELIRVEFELTLEQSAAVQAALRNASLQLSDVSVVGFHGQTVLHRPSAESLSSNKPGRTLQLGSGELGQGAPLAPIYHQALMRAAGMDRATIIVNLGGISNLTWWDQQQGLIAFDAGPANAPIDDDGAALLAAVCASAIDKALALLPVRAQRLILCGGGRHNRAIRQEMATRTGCKVLLAEDVGWRGDAIEAECFAFLAERNLFIS